MKKTGWIILTFSFIFVLLIGIVMRILFPSGLDNSEADLKKINEMAEFINQKYGYSFTSEDVTFFMEEDYSSWESFIVTVEYEIPYVAVFEKDGKRITVTDRKGFLSDDAQLMELNEYICYYCERVTGLENLEYVHIRDATSANIPDQRISDVLQFEFNQKIDENNIDEFMEQLFYRMDYLEMIFYFRETDDREAQLQQITQQLGILSEYEYLASLSFYTFLSDEELKIEYWERDLEEYLEKGNKPDQFSFGNYYIPNPHELYSYGIEEATTFAYYGAYQMDRGYNGGFGEYSDRTFAVNGWRVADMTKEDE